MLGKFSANNFKQLLDKLHFLVTIISLNNIMIKQGYLFIQKC